MILLVGTACLAVAIAALCPDTALGRALHRALVETPSQLLTRDGLAKGSAGVLVLLFLLSIATAPELVAVMAIADLTIYFEVITVAMLLGASLRIKAVVEVTALPARWLARRFAYARLSISGRAASNTRAVRRKVSKPAEDPERGWTPAFA